MEYPRTAVIADMLQQMDDLGDAERMIQRERDIRDGMARTGEGREVVTEAVDVLSVIPGEAVLELTDGNPTTLQEALKAYIRELEGRGDTTSLDTAADLETLLDYPWRMEEAVLASHLGRPGLRLRMSEKENSILVVVGESQFGSVEIVYDDASVADAVKTVAEYVHRAMLARVIGDRNHSVQLNRVQTESLIGWLDQVRRSGSWRTTDTPRVSVDAVEGGVLIRTRPYSFYAGEGAVLSEGRQLRNEDARRVTADQHRRALEQDV